jgi:hypothetical protein
MPTLGLGMRWLPNGVINSQGVYHGDMWLPSEHHQVDSELLYMLDKVPE